MYEPAKVDVFADQGSASDLGIGALQPAGSSGAGGLDPMTLLRLGRSAYGLLGPELGLPSFSEIGGSLGLPSMAEIGSSLGLEGILGGGAAGMGALGGLTMAMGYAAPAMLVAQLLASIPSTDGPVSRGRGIGSLDMAYRPLAGHQEIPSALYDQWKGDGSWYAGGDTSKVDPLTFDYGSMSRNSDIPYRSIGGAPYRNDALAVNSGRQIARGMMGLPVDYEPLPMGRDYATGSQQVARVALDRSLPVWDAPQAVPEQWNLMQDRADLMIGGGGSNTEANVWSPDVIDAYKGMMSDRGREWFDTGLRTNDMYGMTGPQMADLPLYSGELDAARNDTAKRLGDAAGITDAKPFDPYSYGFGAGRNFFPDQRQPGKYPG